MQVLVVLIKLIPFLFGYNKYKFVETYFISSPRPLFRRNDFYFVATNFYFVGTTFVSWEQLLFVSTTFISLEQLWICDNQMFLCSYCAFMHRLNNKTQTIRSYVDDKPTMTRYVLSSEVFPEYLTFQSNTRISL